MTEHYDLVVVGGGIIGLATARELRKRFPDASLLVVEKERAWALHQTGHNSGVIHSGIYYTPGSLKARLCVAGSRSMVEFCREHRVPVAVPGKLIVASDPSELPRMEALLERGRANGLKLRRLGAAEIREREPHLRAVAGIEVPTTGVVDYRQVAAALVHLLERDGVALRLGTEVRGFSASSGSRGREHVLHTGNGDLRAGYLVTCAGLHADRLARAAGADPGTRIMPFRGEYYELAPHARDLVRGLVYPVPDPAFPFLGVHLTRTLDGNVHVGPNAVPAASREGYTWGSVSARDLAATLAYPGWWRLARRYWRTGLQEVVRSLSLRAFLADLRRLYPDVSAADLLPAPAGVRAQALARDGRLVDDFVIARAERATHVCNAPSPAATASLEIAREIVAGLPADAAR
jgi:L-2-hydroxyglutarate oxidase